MTSTQTAETLQIDGITYEVVKADTAETMADRGLVNLASVMRQNGINRELGLRRPKGRVIYWACEYTTRFGLTYSSVTSLGGARR